MLATYSRTHLTCSSMEPVLRGLNISLPRYTHDISTFWNLEALFDIASPRLYFQSTVVFDSKSNIKNKTQIKSNNYIPEFILSMLCFHEQTSIDALFICKVKIILILLKHQILNILFHIIPVGTTISVCW